jgi:hypothetical protein
MLCRPLADVLFWIVAVNVSTSLATCLTPVIGLTPVTPCVVVDE